MKKYLLFFFVPVMASAEMFPGNDLLTYFQANCRTQGEWTRSALADSIALMDSVKKMAEDPDCRNAVSALTQLEQLKTQLTSIQNLNATQTQIANINSKEQEIIFQLSDVNTDPDAIAGLQAALMALQQERAGLLGTDRAQRELQGPDKAQLMMGVVQATNGVFRQITANQKCMLKNSAILRTATTMVSAVGSAATMVNPALGLGISAGSAFLGETIEGIRDSVQARRIRKISEDSLAPEAYKCALETMSERWCQMRDAEAFLNFKANYRASRVQDLSLAAVLRLNDREIPVIMEWLNKVRTGVKPMTSADASRQSVIFAKRASLDALEAMGSGIIEENRKIFESMSDANDKWNFLISLIAKLTPTEPGNPLSEVITTQYAPFFLLGLPDDNTIRNAQGEYYALASWPRGSFSADLEVVKSQYDALIAKSRARVNQELNQVLQPDPLQTLASAFERTGNVYKLSPMTSLKNSIDFMEKFPPKDPTFTLVYRGTLYKLKEIYRIVQEAVVSDDYVEGNNSASSKLRAPLEQIFEIAQLQYGTVVLSARIDMLVRLAILEFIETSKPEDQILVAQFLAAERMTDTISKMSGTENLALIRADIKRAQPITISNLNTFIDVFDKSIERILKKLHSEEKAQRNPNGAIARSKRYARTELCFLLLSVPTMSRKVDVSLCEGLKMEATIPGGPETAVITRATFDKDLDDRACQYREYFRQSKIFENWGVKP